MCRLSLHTESLYIRPVLIACSDANFGSRIKPIVHRRVLLGAIARKTYLLQYLYLWLSKNPFPRLLQFYLAVLIYLCGLLDCYPRYPFIARPVYLNLFYVMARRGKTRQRIRRTIAGTRKRIPERVRIWAQLKLRRALNMPALINERGADLVNDIADSAASSYLQRVCRLEGEYDPELYCCSEVSSNDSEDEF